jgi:hypothetical protein
MVGARIPLEARYETYVPEPRQLIFHKIPRWRGFNKLVKGAIGGIGGGKSAACMQEQAWVCRQTPNGNSIAGRQSMPKAKMSLIDDYGEFLGRVAEWRAGSYHFANGHRLVICPIDKWDRQGSTKFVSAYVQEAQEVADARSLLVLSERLRHPAGIVNGVPYYRLLFDSRPIEHRHWIAEKFIANAWNVEEGPEARTRARMPHWVYVRFQTYDNSHLRPGYVEELEFEYGDDPRFIRMMLYGEIGYSLDGKPVYGDAYKPELHDATIEEDPRLVMLRSWDFGYHYPAVTWSQYTRDGRLLTLREFCPKDISLERFMDEMEALQKDEFPNRHPSQYRDFGDIAGDQVDWTGQKPHDIVMARFETSFEGLRKAKVEDGVNVVRKLMMKPARSLDGRLRTRYLVDTRCETLREAFRGGYRYPDTGNVDKPKKGTPYDGVADTVRYVAQSVAGEPYENAYEWTGGATTTDFAAYGPHG